MAEGQEDKFYDVEKFRRLLEAQGRTPPRGPLWLLVGKVLLLFDSVSGLFSALLGLPIFFLGIVAVFLGVFYGPLVFLASAGGAFGLIGLYVNRKVGKSLQFGAYSLPRRVIAQTIGFVLALGLLLFLISLPTILRMV